MIWGKSGFGFPISTNSLNAPTGTSPPNRRDLGNSTSVCCDLGRLPCHSDVQMASRRLPCMNFITGESDVPKKFCCHVAAPNPVRIHHVGQHQSQRPVARPADFDDVCTCACQGAGWALDPVGGD